jgi:glycosyltransferase involved in cell wall biosynthesis
VTIDRGQHSGSPLISLIVSIYGVEDYIRDFLDSLAMQGEILHETELIFVDDGAVDGSIRILDEWLASRPGTRAEVIRRSNGGLSSARNAGLERARGVWVSFPDPDDVLAPGYLNRVSDFLGSSASHDASLVATNIIFLHDETGTLQNDHPLRFRFDGPRPVVRPLDEFAHFIHLQAASGFYRLEVIRRERLSFDEAIVPFAEDLAFTSYYLMCFSSPALGVIPQARYRYRRRETSLIGTSWRKESRYTVVPELAYLKPLREACRRLGSAPRWLENVVLYDLNWYFREHDKMRSLATAVSPAAQEIFMDHVREIVALLSADAIRTFRLTPMSLRTRRALLGLRGDLAAPTEIRVVNRDAGVHLIELRYEFSGARPQEEFRHRGVPVEAHYAKDRGVRYFGATVYFERIAWLPSTGWLEATLDGERVPLEYGAAATKRYTVTEKAAAQFFGQPVVAPVAKPAPARPLALIRRVLRPRTRLADAVKRLHGGRATRRQRRDLRWARRVQWLASTLAVRARYGRAWVFIDRDTEAHDNAEALFRHVAARHGSVNSWFVVDKNSRDYRRLRREGLRVVPHRGLRHILLLLNAEHLISSQVDHYVVQPLDRRLFGPSRWKFTFLQHGVIKDDLSYWLDGKPIARFLTSSPDEHASIVADGTPYRFSDKEVRMTGLPRHDRLIALAAQTPVAARDLVVCMPTWRASLMDETGRVGNRRRLHPGFSESAYAVNWSGLLSDPTLATRLGQLGLELVMMPHPNLEGLVGTDFAGNARMFTYADHDFAEVLARARVVVTDYSSNAIEAAIANRPVLYFQFDREEFAAGHAYRAGYFDYERDGFGPVATNLGDASRMLVELARAGEPQDPYASRALRALPLRDGESCERAYQSIVDLSRPPTR